ncbi:unnamed protein product [Euphydryas editha]|uniref:Uncharacterized protein n=1 Tax=Euphydryas editha TaxID=104508 RepID=A0AAU9UMA9_EUPED|nr:unnamed protein product [Euphydryas editha]
MRQLGVILNGHFVGKKRLTSTERAELLLESDKNIYRGSDVDDIDYMVDDDYEESDSSSDLAIESPPLRQCSQPSSGTSTTCWTTDNTSMKKFLFVIQTTDY